MLKQQTSSHSQVLRTNDKRLASTYPFSLNFYLIPPPYELTLNEFETYALSRLKVLKTIETARIRTKDDAKVAEHVENVVSKELPLARNSQVKGGRIRPEEAYEQRKKDHISHFILRLAYCRTEDLRQWFLKQETALFQYRYTREEAAEQEAFVHHSGLGSAQLSQEERKEVSVELQQTHGLNAQDVNSTTFYRVPFEQVLDLVARRQVFVKGGWAYVPGKEQPVLVANAFRERLRDALEATAKALPRMDEDDRLVPILNSIAKQYVSKEYNPSGAPLGGQIGHDDIDGLVAHFPPCMRHLHLSLRRDAHLKHFGRLQYGLFLKGIGLPLEEALIFWRKAFHRLTDEEFQKKGYPYNVRYNYGLEGKRTNYTPYSCVKIITSNQPGAGDHHGCPFRHFSPDNLREMLHRYGVGEAGITDVMRMAKGGHYQVACTRLFEMTRGEAHRQANAAAGAAGGGGGGDVVDTIEHPNQYFDMSFRGSERGAAASGKAGNSGTESGKRGGMSVDR
ncbi:DNA primase large subunit [Borealophlyctis nickersoniae]|nr:DNA primase large subunit [Borealophlyctis nickersoniae]